MKLRKKAKYEMDSYLKMLDLRRESVRVLKILQMIWNREEYKKKIQLCEQKAFEIQFEGMLKERGIITTTKTT